MSESPAAELETAELGRKMAGHLARVAELLVDVLRILQCVAQDLQKLHHAADAASKEAAE